MLLKVSGVIPETCSIRLKQIGIGKVPIGQMIEKRGDKLCSPILVIEVIGMLPKIADQKRRRTVEHWKVCIVRRADFQRSTSQGQP